MARIRHVAIRTPDPEKTAAFYMEVFGLREVGLASSGYYLSDGHINLAIIPIGPEREIEGPHLQPGINHFGFEVEDIAAIAPICKELGAADEVTRRPPNREAESRVHDPDGNSIDLSQHGWPV